MRPLLILLFLACLARHTSCELTFDDIIFGGEPPPDYNKFACPSSDGHAASLVQVFLHVESIRDIHSEATLDFYLVQTWNDSRLLASGHNQTRVKMTGRVLPDNVWLPDTYFLLVRHLLYSPEEQYFLLEAGGRVEYNRKVRLNTPCSPDVLLFPFDVVRCTVILNSFGYTAQEVRYQWMVDGGGFFVDPVNNGVDHLGFFVREISLVAKSLDYAGVPYSALEATVHLERKYTAYLLQIYAPSALIVILSWSIFWVNIHATPARASLGVTTVLTMLTLATQSTGQNAKHVSGKLTALDVYIWACFVFVIFAMMEFALSDYTIHSRPTPTAAAAHRPDEQHRQGAPPAAAAAAGTSNILIFENAHGARSGAKSGRLGRAATSDGCAGRSGRRRRLHWLGPSVNNMARFLFPAGFLLFNLLYWSVLYVRVTQTKQHTARGAMGD